LHIVDLKLAIFALLIKSLIFLLNDIINVKIALEKFDFSNISFIWFKILSGEFVGKKN